MNKLCNNILQFSYLLLVLDSSRSARTETLLLVFLVTLALLLTLATRGRPPATSGSVFSVLLSSKLARLTNESSG